MKQFTGKPVGLYARGADSTLAATYLLARGAYSTGMPIAWYLLRDGLVSYHQFIERPKSLELSYKLQPDARERFDVYDREIPFHYYPFGALKFFDLRQLLAGAKAKGLIVNPINGDWEPAPEEDARKMIPPAIRLVTDGDLDKSIGEFTQSVGGWR